MRNATRYPEVAPKFLRTKNSYRPMVCLLFAPGMVLSGLDEGIFIPLGEEKQLKRSILLMDTSVMAENRTHTPMT